MEHDGHALCEQIPAMAGHRIGITADRRAEEQGELLRRMGADVVLGPVLRMLPFAEDQPMRDMTEALLESPPDVVVLTTGIGVRAWIGAAETWGRADDLLAVLARATIHVRGPKAHAAAVQLGLTVSYREPTERLDALVAELTRGRLEGRHVAIQLYGHDVPWAEKALREAGALVTAVPVYRWVAPDDEAPARRLVRDALDGQLAAMTFTSPSAVGSICRIADAEGTLDDLLAAFQSRVAAACVGPTTAAAAAQHGIRVACAPPRGRLGLLVRALAATLRERHVHLDAGGREIVLQGGLLVADDGARISLPDRERQVLTALARRTGAVVSRSAIEREVWGSTDEDRALDAVLTRVRRHIAPSGLAIGTRVRRGYQLLATARACPAAAPAATD
jgi:uroporphyrinogen-III synthase